MDARHHTGRRKWAWFAVGGLVAFVIFAVVAHRAFVAPRELSTYFARLHPDMRYSEVMQLMPRAMITADKLSCTSVVWRTVLIRSNASPATEVYCAGPLSPLPGIEVGIIYFDAQDRLIGAYYNSSGAGGWTPRWGTRHE